MYLINQKYIFCILWIFCMHAMSVFYVCSVCYVMYSILSMYLIHVLYACILCMCSRYIVPEWKDGTDEALSELLFWGAISNYFFFLNTWTEFYRDYVHLDPGQGRVECTQFLRNSLHLGIPIRRCGWNLLFRSPTKVQMHRIVQELCAFRTCSARVQMNIISGEFRSFG